MATFLSEGGNVLAVIPGRQCSKGEHGDVFIQKPHATVCHQGTDTAGMTGVERDVGADVLTDASLPTVTR